MLVLVIHDINNKERETSFLRELSLQGIVDYEVMPAIMEPKMARRGISRSHKKCVQLARDRGLKEIMVLEDDVWFLQKSSYDRFINIYETETPDDADILLAGGYDGIFTPIGSKLAVGSGKHAGFFCYIVKERFYDKFLAADENYNIDHFLTAEDLTNARCYVAYPMLALQYDGLSYNTGVVTNYNPEMHRRFKLWDGK